MSETIGELLKKLRLAAGYESLGQLYRDSNVTVATLSRIESGNQHPQPVTLKKLAPWLKVSYEHLLERAGYINDDFFALDELDLSKVLQDEDVVIKVSDTTLNMKQRQELAKAAEKYAKPQESEAKKIVRRMRLASHNNLKASPELESVIERVVQRVLDKKYNEKQSIDTE